MDKIYIAMSDEHKKRISDALNKYSAKQLEVIKPEVRSHNEKPEKEVEKACLKWMRDRGWSVNIFESKAVWNASAGAWTQQGLKAGTCDLMGNTDTGLAVAVEFKAPGALSSFNTEKRYLQKKFIVDKINSNSFAAVIDSVERLEIIFKRWSELLPDRNAARNYLLSMLPQQREKTRLKSEKLFDDE